MRDRSRVLFPSGFSCLFWSTSAFLLRYVRDGHLIFSGFGHVRCGPDGLPQSNFLRQSGALCRVGWSHHRVAFRQAPFFPILFWCHAIGGLEMPLEHLQLFPVLQADDVIRKDRFLHRHGRQQIRYSGRRLSQAIERLKHCADEAGQGVGWNWVAA